MEMKLRTFKILENYQTDRNWILGRLTKYI